VVIALPEDSSARYIEKTANSVNFGCRTIMVTDKYSAICGSDGGICHDGEIIQECAAL